jgi:hypothetical protein
VVGGWGDDLESGGNGVEDECCEGALMVRYKECWADVVDNCRIDRDVSNGSSFVG